MNNTLLKGLAVLELLSRAERPMTLTQIGRELGLGKSNVHRLLQALVDTKFLVRHEGSGDYTASIKLWELGSAVLSKLDLRRHAEAQMERLMEATGESVHLSVLDGLDVVYVHKVESPNPVRAYSQIGGRSWAPCVATGKALLAFCPASMLETISRSLQSHTERSVVDPAAFLREMKRVRDQGLAINRGEWRANVWGIAAPVKDARGSVIAAVGISGPAERFVRSVIADWSAAVTLAAVEISDSLRTTGGANPPPSLLQLHRW